MVSRVGSRPQSTAVETSTPSGKPSTADGAQQTTGNATTPDAAASPGSTDAEMEASIAEMSSSMMMEMMGDGEKTRQKMRESMKDEDE